MREQLLEAMRKRTAGLPASLTGTTVLCIGARLGGEVRAVKSLGALGIGIDLLPGPGSLDVVSGDMEDIPFPARVFGLVYTNVLDHVYNVGGLTSEVCRVLRPGGVFMAVVVGGGAKDAYSPRGAVDESSVEKLKESVARVGLAHRETTVTYHTIWDTGRRAGGAPRRPWYQKLITLYFGKGSEAGGASCRVAAGPRGRSS